MTNGMRLLIMGQVKFKISILLEFRELQILSTHTQSFITHPGYTHFTRTRHHIKQ